MDFDLETMGFATYVDEASEQCEICRTFDKAPHVAIQGAWTASFFNGILQVALLAPDDAIALRAIAIA